MKRLLLVGDTSLPEALGSKLLRGFKSLDISNSWNIDVTYHSPASKFSPSMQNISGKIFFRLADKRSWEWWGFQQSLQNQIEELKPDLILVTGVLPLKNEVFAGARKYGCLITNYLTDDPWNPIHKRQVFLSNLKSYHHIFSTKRALQERLKRSGVVSTSWLPFAYDPNLHYPVPSQSSADVVFVGTGASERLPWLKEIANLQGVVRHIHGNNWEKIATPHWEQHPAVTGEDYCQAISGAGVVLGLLRAANGDQSTDRSYEIGAIGGCGLYQDTTEHRELLTGYPEIGFFQDPSELALRVEDILGNPELQQELRRIGMKAIRKPENTYAARLRTILDWFEK